MEDSAEQARQRAIGLAAETMGEIVDFWGFKASMGRIWTLLYLSTAALPADVIATRTHLSAGAVSMALSELMQWGLVAREPLPNERKRHYRAETDIWGIIRRIIRERELRVVARAVKRFEEAHRILEEIDNPDEETRFVKQRLKGLLELAHLGYSLVERLADIGQFSLAPIRGVLSWGRKRSDQGPGSDAGGPDAAGSI